MALGYDEAADDRVTLSHDRNLWPKSMGERHSPAVSTCFILIFIFRGLGRTTMVQIEHLH